MIKVYCDQCGKEIVDNVNVFSDDTEVRDGHNVLISYRGKTLYYCDECKNGGLTCGFKVGDQVITDDGRTGAIESFCDCKSCKKRGFYEPQVKMHIGNNQIYITDSDKRNGFMSFYQIGGKRFGNIDKDQVLDDIERKKQEIKNAQIELIELEAQLTMLKKLK